MTAVFSPARLAAAALAVVLLSMVGIAARAAAPAGRYVSDDVTVSDQRTGLVWRRHVTADRLSYAAAKVACASLQDGGSNWRLPTLAELETLVDVRAVNPAVDRTAFDDTPPARFWTSTASADTTGAWWSIDFTDGTNGVVQPDALLAFRCVRTIPVAPSP